MNQHPTPIKWMGKNIWQEHILRYLDRENPIGEIMTIQPFGPRGLIVSGADCLEYIFICNSDGTVRRFDDDEEVSV